MAVIGRRRKISWIEDIILSIATATDVTAISTRCTAVWPASPKSIGGACRPGSIANFLSLVAGDWKFMALSIIQYPNTIACRPRIVAGARIELELYDACIVALYGPNERIVANALFFGQTLPLELFLLLSATLCRTAFAVRPAAFPIRGIDLHFGFTTPFTDELAGYAIQKTNRTSVGFRSEYRYENHADSEQMRVIARRHDVQPFSATPQQAE
jgi:hypothetical protein